MVVGTQKRGGSSKQKRPRTDMNFQVLPVNNDVQVHDTFTVRFPLLQFPPKYKHYISMRGASDLFHDCIQIRCVEPAGPSYVQTLCRSNDTPNTTKIYKPRRRGL